MYPVPPHANVRNRGEEVVQTMSYWGENKVEEWKSKGPLEKKRPNAQMKGQSRIVRKITGL